MTLFLKLRRHWLSFAWTGLWKHKFSFVLGFFGGGEGGRWTSHLRPEFRFKQGFILQTLQSSWSAIVYVLSFIWQHLSNIFAPSSPWTSWWQTCIQPSRSHDEPSTISVMGWVTLKYAHAAINHTNSHITNMPLLEQYLISSVQIWACCYMENVTKGKENGKWKMFLFHLIR